MSKEIRDEIKKQAEKTLHDSVEAVGTDEFAAPVYLTHIEQALLDRHNESVEMCAEIPEKWVVSKSCGDHEDNPCCHVRLADKILEMIRALKEKP